MRPAPSRRWADDISPDVMKRRGRIRMSAILILCGALLLVGFVWFRVTQPLLPAARGRESPAVDPARLEAHVRALSETLPPRDASHPEGMDAAAAYVRGEFERSGAAVSEQRFEVAGRAYRNVIAAFGPAGGEQVVVGAHYDSAGPLPGADDNASGVGGLAELVPPRAKAPPPLRVGLGAVGLEEAPLFPAPHMGG